MIERAVYFTYPVILLVWARQKFSAEQMWKNKQEPQKCDFACFDRQYLFIFSLYV